VRPFVGACGCCGWLLGVLRLFHHARPSYLLAAITPLVVFVAALPFAHVSSFEGRRVYCTLTYLSLLTWLLLGTIGCLCVCVSVLFRFLSSCFLLWQDYIRFVYQLHYYLSIFISICSWTSSGRLDWNLLCSLP
jgi:hypothetical protein